MMRFRNILRGMKLMIVCFGVYALSQLSLTNRVWQLRQTYSDKAQLEVATIRPLVGIPSVVRGQKLKYTSTKRDPWNKCPEKKVLSGKMPTLLEITAKMGDDWHWDWIKQRITSMWSEWLEGGNKLRDPSYRSDNSSAKRILVIPGVVTLTNMAQPGVIRTGGPLGDLVQWADVIAGLHVIGHDVTLRHDIGKTSARLTLTQPGCAYGGYDLIYTDILGAKQLSKNVVKRYKCRLRIIDAYGTEAMYNYPDSRHPMALKHRSSYGGLGLHLKQFFTYYPHTPDNSFMGFVVPSRLKSHKYSKKENIALIYGKSMRYLRGKEKYIKAIQSVVPVHATLPEQPFKNVTNHGIISHSEYHSLVKRVKICIGVGQPLESSGALEAIASGCIFLNPRLRDAIKFSGKPTTRQVNSQVPYLENFVGPPYSHTVDMENISAVVDLVTRISRDEVEVKPFIPYEFTCSGFLERLNVYAMKQNFCIKMNNSTVWPPVTSMVLVTSRPGDSCNHACQQKDLVCEQMYFPFANNVQTMHRFNVICNTTTIEEDVIFPATVQGGKKCFLQNDPLLFSCSQGRDSYIRMCPCRDGIKFQSALCKNCF